MKRSLICTCVAILIIAGISAVYFAWTRRGNEATKTDASQSDNEHLGVAINPSSKTAPVSLTKSMELLYSGPNGSQKDMKQGAIEAKRVAILQGIVRDRDGKPISQVKISVHRHPELGSTNSQKDGSFHLAVNGGGTLCVHYQKQGYLPSCRHITVPWQDYAWLPEVVLISVDETATEINLMSDSPMQIVRGRPVEDKDGRRQATLLIPKGTEAEMFLCDGTKKKLTALHVRLTEYTVGPNGPTAMPAPLPPTSAYTYALELTADEIQINNGIKVHGKDLLLSKPVILCVENFLNFAAGVPVPYGYFDNDEGVWVPGESGRVIKVLALKNGLVELDSDGTGSAMKGEALAKLGITDAERRQLAELYKPGQSFWRTPITHFSTGDLNHAPPGAKGPNQPNADGDPNVGDSCSMPGASVIDIQNQCLEENVPITGTPFTLHYRSDRVPGRSFSRSLRIHLTGEEVPKGLNRVDLEVLVAGRRFARNFPPEAKQTHTFIWDGKDTQGRPLQGAQPVTIRIGYVYTAVPYGQAERFGEASNGRVIAGSATRGEITLWQEQKTRIGSWDARTQALGGWSLNIHHAYDPLDRVLYLGDGRRRSTGGLGRGGHHESLSIMAGQGDVGYSGDGGPAIRANLAGPRGLAAGPDGSIYVAETYNHCVRRIWPSGMITTVAGTGKPGYGGDGGSAAKALLYWPNAVVMAPDGGLYVSDTGNYLIRWIAPDGTISTVAGVPPSQWSGKPPKELAGNFVGDGGPATKARFNEPTALALGLDNSLYITDTENQRIRRIGPDNIITTVAGTGTAAFTGDGGPALNAGLSYPSGLAVGPDGSLYVYDGCFSDSLGRPYPYHRVRRVSVDGLISTVAGGGKKEALGDGGPAIEARLDNYKRSLGAGVRRGRSPRFLREITVGLDGTLYLLDENDRIRRVTPDGLISTVAGGGEKQIANNIRSLEARLQEARGLALGPDGSLFFSMPGRQTLAGRQNQPGNHVCRLGSPLPGFTDKDIVLVSENGGELYKFDKSGRHRETLDAFTGKAIFRFSHDVEDRLSKIEDAYGNITAIERDPNGQFITVVAPFGQRTTLELDSETGYLKTAANPAGEAVTFTYHGNEGLLATRKDPLGQVARFTYDDMGRLLKDEDPAGGFTELARTESARGFEIGLTTAGKKIPTTYLTEHLPTGEEVRLNKCCCGAETKVEIAPDGSRKINYPDGAVATLVEQADPRWGMQSPLLKSLLLTTPAGLKSVITLDYQVSLADQTNPLSVNRWLETLAINNWKYSRTFDASNRQTITVTPTKRQYVSTVDADGRIIRMEAPGLFPVHFKYNENGNVSEIRQGEGEQARVVAISYDTSGLIATIVDPLKYPLRFGYDKAGRLKSQIVPGGSETSYNWDPRGNLKSLTPPGRPPHSFEYTSVNRRKVYLPPAVGEGPNETQYAYNMDGQLIQVTRPDKNITALSYDPAGRLESISTPDAKLRLAYGAKTDHLTEMATADSHLSFTYDGFLPTKTTWDGVIKGTVSRSYDNDFRLASVRINDGPPIEYKYDPDGLLVQAGKLVLERDPKTGFVTNTNLGNIRTAQEYNGFGERKHFTAKFKDKEFFAVDYVRDALGRIVKKTESIEGQTDVYTYEYDRDGRLTEVTKNGKIVGHYEYDSNGNRILYKGQLGEFKARYDDQDRILQYGEIKLDHTPNGELASKTAGGKVVQLGCDVHGNLRNVDLGDGRKILYVVDGADRRIGKKIESKLVQGLIYENSLRPMAELDGNNNVVSQFVYGTKINVPECMQKEDKTYRIITDHLGGPRFVVDAASGEIAQRMDYDEFGNVLQNTRPGLQPFGFAGGLYDEQTRLVHFGARDFDALTGRWLTTDPLGFLGAETNLYAYARNDPVSLTDPEGLWIPAAIAEGVRQKQRDDMINGSRSTPSKGAPWVLYNDDFGRNHMIPNPNDPNGPPILLGPHRPVRILLPKSPLLDRDRFRPFDDCPGGWKDPWTGQMHYGSPGPWGGPIGVNQRGPLNVYGSNAPTTLGPTIVIEW
jgi:RHS repeat-associated protein